MYKQWTRDDIKDSLERISRLYVKTPIEYRFLCGHAIQSEDDEDALDYYMIGAWLVQHRKYVEWSEKKSYDLAEILEFMRIYQMKIPLTMQKQLSVYRFPHTDSSFLIFLNYLFFS